MAVPLAVDPSNAMPGIYITANLLSRSNSGGATGLRCALITPPTTVGGDLTVGTAIRAVYSKEDIETAAGKCLGYYAYQALVANDPAALVDLVTCAESTGVLATQTITFGGTVTSNEVYRIFVDGVPTDVAANVGDALTTNRDNAVTAFNAKGTDLPVIAVAGTGGVFNLNARQKGLAGNDIQVRVVKLSGAGGTCVAGGSTLAGGTLEVDITTALGTIAGREYDYILPCLGAADATSATGNPQKVTTHIDTYLTGSSAKLQQAVIASNGTTNAAAKVNTAARNHTNLEHVLVLGEQSLPCEIAGAALGDRMRRRRRESNANRVRQPLKRLRGSADPVADMPTDTEGNDCLNNGISIGSYDASGNVILARSVTTHWKDSSGNQDRRCFDTNEVDGIYDVIKDLRGAIGQEFQSPDGQVKVIPNLVEGDPNPPANTVEIREIRSFIIARILRIWVPKGVIDGVAFQTSVDDNTFKVEINGTDGTQVDIFLPLKVVKILAKIGLYVAKTG